MVESGVTDGGKTLPVFFFVNEHDNTNWLSLKLKSNDFQSYPRRETAAIVEETDADDIRKVLCK